MRFFMQNSAVYKLFTQNYKDIDLVYISDLQRCGNKSTMTPFALELEMTNTVPSV